MENHHPVAEPDNAELEQLAQLYQQQNPIEAEKLARDLIRRFPQHNFAWKILGFILQNQGKTQESLAAKETAVRLSPDDAQALCNLGNACQQQNRLDEAEHYLKKALSADPKAFMALNNLGLTLEKKQRYDEAEQCYRQCLTINPGYATAHFNYGNLLQKQGRFEIAEKAYQQAIDCRPDYVPAYNNLALMLDGLGRYQDQEACCRKMLELQPNNPESHYNLANALQNLERFQEAEQSYRQALALSPDHLDAHINYASTLQKMQRIDEAEQVLRAVLKIKPDYDKALNNLGMMFVKQERLQEAEESYRQMLAFDPNHADTHSNFSLMLLLQGRYEEGWREYQWIYHPENGNPGRPRPPETSAKQWQGEPLEGKTILIAKEQGFGDMIQFARYAEHLKAAGATKVWIVVKQPLQAIFETIPWVDRVLLEGEALPDCDFWTFPLALPFRFQTTLENLPCNVPYLSAEAAKTHWWKIWLDKQVAPGQKRIGLVWAGRPTQGNDKNRSLNLDQFSVFAGLEGITFVSLQLGDKRQQLKNAPEGLQIVDAGRFIEDFTDSAALLQNLDLLITVCSAPAHLAGALDLPVWTIISRPFDWRWLREGEHSVWYRSMRLFRQPTRGDWDSVLETVKMELMAL